MEKIKDALKKAKSGVAVNRAMAPSVRRNGVKQLQRHDEVLEKIVYNQENVFEIEPKHLEEYRIVAHDKMNPSSWIYDTLRTQVLQKMDENDWHSIAIISPTASSGKTITAINLGISIAQSPQKTSMVVDFDMRKPKLATYLGVEHDKSMNEFLKGTADLSEIIINPSIPRFTVIPTNSPVKNSSEILSRSKVRGLMSELRERYESRVVIFDLPPILQADDAMVVLPHVDCALLVVADGANTESELIQTMRLLDKTNILGSVINRSEERQQQYY